MNTEEMIKNISKKTGYSEDETAKVINIFFEEMKCTLVTEEPFNIKELGRFRARSSNNENFVPNFKIVRSTINQSIQKAVEHLPVNK